MTRRITGTAGKALRRFSSAEPPPFATPSSPDSRIDPWRSAAALVSLIAIGAILGATIAPALLAVVGRIVDGPGGFPYVWDAFWFVSILGAFLGGVLAPFTRVLGPSSSTHPRNGCTCSKRVGDSVDNLLQCLHVAIHEAVSVVRNPKERELIEKAERL